MVLQSCCGCVAACRAFSSVKCLLCVVLLWIASPLCDFCVSGRQFLLVKMEVVFDFEKVVVWYKWPDLMESCCWKTWPHGVLSTLCIISHYFFCMVLAFAWPISLVRKEKMIFCHLVSAPTVQEQKKEEEVRRRKKWEGYFHFSSISSQTYLSSH